MARVPSTMLALGTSLPPFALPNAVDGATVASTDYDDRKVLVVMFICNHCPFVVHIRDGLTQIERDYRDRDVAFVAISSNDADAYPQDAPAAMKREAEEHGYRFPYVFDATQEIAKAFAAACTPDFYVFDNERKLVYRGAFDDARPGNGVPVTGSYVRAAIDAALAGEPGIAEQKPSLGCNIKWKAGNAPAYFGA